jgi:hypothetical protein
MRAHAQLASLARVGLVMRNKFDRRRGPINSAWWRGGWLEIDNTISDLSTGLSASTSGLHRQASLRAGIEWAFASNWSLRIEYDYIALESYSVTSPFAAGDMLNVSNNSVQTVTFGINYLFSRGS